MIVIYAGVLLILAILFFLSKEEEGDCFTRMAWHVHKKMHRFLPPHLLGRGREKRAKELEREMKSLYPGESVSYHMTKYQVEKIRIALLVLLGGSLLGMLFLVKENQEKRLSREGMLQRGEFGEDNSSIELQYAIEHEASTILLTIPSRTLNTEELEEMKKEYREQLMKEMLGDNPSLQNVSNSLVFPSSLEGYPFSIQWFSEDYHLVSITGELAEDILEETRVTIYAEISYEEVNWTEEFSLLLCPREKTEQSRTEQIQEAVYKSMEEAASQKEVLLPETIEGKKIVWTEKKSPYHYLIIPMILFAMGSVLWGMDQDVIKKRKERQQLLLADYPVLLHKFTVFLCAGMNVKSIFLKLGNDYGKEKQQGELSPLEQEIVLAVRELQAGKGEEMVYVNWGQRIGLKEYKRFSTILVQTLKKGNDALIDRLYQECDEALRESMNIRKKRGEETENSLLIPMVLMLVVVMLMVLFPALISIQI